MGVQLGHEFAKAVAQVMGLDPSMLSSISIDASTNEAMKLTAVHLVPQDRADKILEIIAEYEIVVRRTSSEVVDREEPAF